jgi:hypothetical protein
VIPSGSEESVSQGDPLELIVSYGQYILIFTTKSNLWFFLSLIGPDPLG